MEIVQRARSVRPPNLELNAGSDNENCRPPRAVRGAGGASPSRACWRSPAQALSAGGFGAVDGLLLVLFGVHPALVGDRLLERHHRLPGDAVRRAIRSATVLPGRARVRGDEPITASTAIAMFVRNEPPDRVVRNLDAMMRELAAAGVADRFHLYVLSDTSHARRSPRSRKKRFGALAAEMARPHPGDLPPPRPSTPPSRPATSGTFCERWGDQHEFAVTLDTDSFMTAAAILRMVRIMQADPKLGILQGLVVGLPSTSAFARMFQFGMRLGMRSWTIGSAWWQGDCGPYWGHNAVIRIAPFKAHCHIPKLPEGGVLGGHVLSHDQIEAALMRRAGYDVRVLPEEDLGWEENPPTLIEYLRRDQRWCQGTLQYGHFLFMPRHEAGQPLPARLRDADVPRLAGLDRHAGGRHAGGRRRADARRFHRSAHRLGAAGRSSW